MVNRGINQPGYTTRPGFVNENRQANLGPTNPPIPGNLDGQIVYVMQCLDCRATYGANGCDIHERKCPYCQDGQPGLDYGRRDELA